MGKIKEKMLLIEEQINDAAAEVAENGWIDVECIMQDIEEQTIDNIIERISAIAEEHEIDEDDIIEIMQQDPYDIARDAIFDMWSWQP